MILGDFVAVCLACFKATVALEVGWKTVERTIPSHPLLNRTISLKNLKQTKPHMPTAKERAEEADRQKADPQRLCLD